MSTESDLHSALIIALLYALSYEKLIKMRLKCTNKTLVPAWISNYIHYKVWDEITYPFPNFKGATIEVWEWISNFFTHFMMAMITNPFEIKVKPYMLNILTRTWQSPVFAITWLSCSCPFLSILIAMVIQSRCVGGVPEMNRVHFGNDLEQRLCQEPLQ